MKFISSQSRTPLNVNGRYVRIFRGLRVGLKKSGVCVPDSTSPPCAVSYTIFEIAVLSLCILCLDMKDKQASMKTEIFVVEVCHVV